MAETATSSALHQAFLPTRWSVVLAASQRSTPESAADPDRGPIPRGFRLPAILAAALLAVLLMENNLVAQTPEPAVLAAAGAPELQSPRPPQVEEKLGGQPVGQRTAPSATATPPTDAGAANQSPNTVSYEAAFRDLYDTCGQKYPCFEMKGINWKAVGEELLPRAAKVQSDKEFALLSMELVARLQDTHAALLPGTARLPEIEMPRWAPDFVCLEDDRGDPVVYALRSGSKGEQAGVKRGMRLLKVNGVAARERLAGFIRFMKKYEGFSSERLAQLEGTRFFLLEKQRGAKMAFEMDDASGSYHFDLTADDEFGYYPRLPVPIPGIADNGTVSWTRLKDDIGYIYVRRMRNDLEERLDKAVAALKGVRGLIIDLRGNSGGGFDSDTALVNFMLDHPEIQPNRPRYQGPIALLTDALCSSAGEGWASWFVANKRARVFGQATAGASSAKQTFPVKNGLYQVRLPIKPYPGFLDRPIERRGIEPEVPLMPNARDLAVRRDTVLEAAKASLVSNAPGNQAVK